VIVERSKRRSVEIGYVVTGACPETTGRLTGDCCRRSFRVGTSGSGFAVSVPVVGPVLLSGDGDNGRTCGAETGRIKVIVNEEAGVVEEDAL
jgi:hypothetical protein